MTTQLKSDGAVLKLTESGFDSYIKDMTEAELYQTTIQLNRLSSNSGTYTRETIAKLGKFGKSIEEASKKFVKSKEKLEDSLKKTNEAALGLQSIMLGGAVPVVPPSTAGRVHKVSDEDPTKPWKNKKTTNTLPKVSEEDAKKVAAEAKKNKETPKKDEVSAKNIPITKVSNLSDTDKPPKKTPSSKNTESVQVNLPLEEPKKEEPAPNIVNIDQTHAPKLEDKPTKKKSSNKKAKVSPDANTNKTSDNIPKDSPAPIAEKSAPVAKKRVVKETVKKETPNKTKSTNDINKIKPADKKTDTNAVGTSENNIPLNKKPPTKTSPPSPPNNEIIRLLRAILGEGKSTNNKIEKFLGKKVKENTPSANKDSDNKIKESTIALREKNTILREKEIEEKKRKHLSDAALDAAHLEQRRVEDMSRTRRHKMEETAKTRRAEIHAEETKLKQEGLAYRQEAKLDADKRKQTSRARTILKRTKLVEETKRYRIDTLKEQKEKDREYKEDRDEKNRAERQAARRTAELERRKRESDRKRERNTEFLKKSSETIAYSYKFLSSMYANRNAKKVASHKEGTATGTNRQTDSPDSNSGMWGAIGNAASTALGGFFGIKGLDKILKGSGGNSVKALGSGAAKMGTKSLPILGGLVSGISEFLDSGNTSKAVSVGVGSSVGTAIGMGVGSFAGPPGIIVGGIIGGLVGDKIADRIYNAFTNWDSVKENFTQTKNTKLGMLMGASYGMVGSIIGGLIGGKFDEYDMKDIFNIMLWDEPTEPTKAAKKASKPLPSQSEATQSAAQNKPVAAKPLPSQKGLDAFSSTDYKGGTPKESDYDMTTKAGRTQYAMDYFQSKGLSKEQSAGVVGNLLVESNLDPTAHNPYDKDSKGNVKESVGIMQWRDARAEKFKAAMQQQGNTDWKKSTLQQQLDYILKEKDENSYESGQWNKVLKNTSSEDVARSFDRNVERSSGEHVERRVSEARKVMEEYTPNKSAQRLDVMTSMKDIKDKETSAAPQPVLIRGGTTVAPNNVTNTTVIHAPDTDPVLRWVNGHNMNPAFVL